MGAKNFISGLTLNIQVVCQNYTLYESLKYTECPNKKWHYRNYLIVLKPLLNARDYTPENLMKLYLHFNKTFSLRPNILTPESITKCVLHCGSYIRY